MSSDTNRLGRLVLDQYLNGGMLTDDQHQEALKPYKIKDEDFQDGLKACVAAGLLVSRGPYHRPTDKAIDTVKDATLLDKFLPLS